MPEWEEIADGLDLGVRPSVRHWGAASGGAGGLGEEERRWWWDGACVLRSGGGGWGRGGFACERGAGS